MIHIGQFHQKLGPICLDPKKGRLCEFSNRICNGFNCPILTDAINCKKDKIMFEDEEAFFQGVKISVKNPLTRGNIERFVVIIKINKGFGLIKNSLIEDMKTNFISMYNANGFNPSKKAILNFQISWEKQFSIILNPTDVTDKERFIREKLNMATLNLQLILMDETSEIPDHIKNDLNQSLLDLYEITSYLKNKNEEDVIFTNIKA